MISTQATTGDESTAMASNEEIADDAALAGTADAYTPVWKSPATTSIDLHIGSPSVTLYAG